MLLKTAAVLENPLWAHEAACPATVFFFPRLAGQDRLDYSVLVLLLFGCLFQSVKTLIADDVFNTTGIGLRSFGVNACGDKLLGKEAVTLVDFFGNFPANIGQMEKVIFVHHKKAAVPQGSHCMAHAGLRDLHVPGHIYGAHYTELLLENKDGFQVVLPGRMKFHLNLLY
nr:MAG: hypothetical protein [Bacteriophage sp.]